MTTLAGLAIFSGLSLNLFLQFALGTGSTAERFFKRGSKRRLPLVQLLNLFIAVFFLWIFFNNILPAYWKGFAEYFLFFPLSALVCMGIELLYEKIFRRVLPLKFEQSGGIRKVFSSLAAYDGLVPAALLITCFTAENAAEAFVLSLFFAFGNLTAMLILSEIRRRSTLERVPRHLRGAPLILVSMGLLSLISASAAGICFKILEVF